MWEDPIVSDVHETRERLAAAFNFDVAAIFADLRARQEALGTRLVHRGPMAPITPESDVSNQRFETEPPRAVS